MALSETVPITAWGDVHLYMGPTGANGAMSATLTDLGSLDEDGFSIESADGTVYTLKDINGRILDELKQEPELTLNFTLLKPSQTVRAMFWDIDETTVVVSSMVKVARQSLKLSNDKVVGSETFEAAQCSVNLKPNYSAAKGYYCTGTAKVLYSEALAGFFKFGTVASV